MPHASDILIALEMSHESTHQKATAASGVQRILLLSLFNNVTKV